jgi:hypothetical protein
MNGAVQEDAIELVHTNFNAPYNIMFVLCGRCSRGAVSNRKLI